MEFTKKSYRLLSKGFEPIRLCQSSYHNKDISWADVLKLDNGKNKIDNLGHYDHSNSLLLDEFAKYGVNDIGKRT